MTVWVVQHGLLKLMIIIMILGSVSFTPSSTSVELRAPHSGSLLYMTLQKRDCDKTSWSLESVDTTLVTSLSKSISRPIHQKSLPRSDLGTSCISISVHTPIHRRWLIRCMIQLSYCFLFWQSWLSIRIVMIISKVICHGLFCQVWSHLSSVLGVES